MSRIFSKLPPEELVLRVFDCFGVKGLFDEKQFGKKDISMEQLDTILPELEPYYTKHKKFMITRASQPKHYIQILRNICHIYKLIFYAKNSDTGVKYRILNPMNPETGFYSILAKEAKEVSKPTFIISFS
jgi:hypothetical protein